MSWYKWINKSSGGLAYYDFLVSIDGDASDMPVLATIYNSIKWLYPVTMLHGNFGR